MIKNNLNLIISTGSGLFGGMAKVFAAGMIQTGISLNQTIEVAFYAAVSALVGYGVKVGIDRFRNRKHNQ